MRHASRAGRLRPLSLGPTLLLMGADPLDGLTLAGTESVSRSFKRKKQE